MVLPWRSSLLLGGLGLLLPLGVSGQGGGPCPPPLNWEIPRSSGFLPPSPGRGSSAATFHLSPEGKLCRRFQVGEDPGASHQALEERVTRPGPTVLASALFPGLGQRILGQDRWTGYAAAEIWGWFLYMERQREGRKLQRQYRDLAWSVARRVSSGPRVDGSFEYYEALSQYGSSGAFDVNPDLPGVQPELDPATYNGAMWALARAIFLPVDLQDTPDPDSEAFQRALDYYLSRAYGPQMIWNWGANVLHQGEYRDLIRASDENLRRATSMVGVILANHLLSAVDALVSTRLGGPDSSGPRVEILLIPGPFATHSVSLTLRLPLPTLP